MDDSTATTFEDLPDELISLICERAPVLSSVSKRCWLAYASAATSLRSILRQTWPSIEFVLQSRTHITQLTVAAASNELFSMINAGNHSSLARLTVLYELPGSVSTRVPQILKFELCASATMEQLAQVVHLFPNLRSLRVKALGATSASRIASKTLRRVVIQEQIANVQTLCFLLSHLKRSPIESLRCTFLSSTGSDLEDLILPALTEFSETLQKVHIQCSRPQELSKLPSVTKSPYFTFLTKCQRLRKVVLQSQNPWTAKEQHQLYLACPHLADLRYSAEEPEFNLSRLPSHMAGVSAAMLPSTSFEKDSVESGLDQVSESLRELVLQFARNTVPVHVGFDRIVSLASDYMVHLNTLIMVDLPLDKVCAPAVCWLLCALPELRTVDLSVTSGMNQKSDPYTTEFTLEHAQSLVKTFHYRISLATEYEDEYMMAQVLGVCCDLETLIVSSDQQCPYSIADASVWMPVLTRNCQSLRTFEYRVRNSWAKSSWTYSHLMEPLLCGLSLIRRFEISKTTVLSSATTMLVAENCPFLQSWIVAEIVSGPCLNKLLRQCPLLEELELHQTNFSKLHAEALARGRRLVNLTLFDCQQTLKFKTPDVLKTLPCLQTVTIRKMELEWRSLNPSDFPFSLTVGSR